jgi:hypothetical protein
MNKANQYASRLAASNRSAMDVFIFHQSTYVPSMTYSLSVTTFEPKVLNKIQSRAIQAILNKLGVSKSFPRRVAFGPKDICGIALLDMSVDQGVRQVQHFTDHVFSKDSVGNLMVIALRSLQLESGCGFHLLECPSEWVPYIMDCWVTCIRDFLDRSKMTRSRWRLQDAYNPVENTTGSLWMSSEGLVSTIIGSYLISTLCDCIYR